MGVWECRQVIDFDQSTTTVKEEWNKNSLLDKSYKSIVYKSYNDIAKVSLLFHLQTFITQFGSIPASIAYIATVGL